MNPLKLGYYHGSFDSASRGLGTSYLGPVQTDCLMVLRLPGPGQKYFWPTIDISGRPEILLVDQNYFWPTRNISGRPEIFLVGQEYFWLARNISGRSEIFLVDQKYSWSVRNISGRPNIFLVGQKYRKIHKHPDVIFRSGGWPGLFRIAYSGSTRSRSGGGNEGK